MVIVTYRHGGIALHVAILGTAEDGAVDNTACDLQIHSAHIRALVEMDALVTLTATEDVGGQRVSGNLSQCAGHTDGTARHGDVAGAGHIGHLITAIDVREDMTAADGQVSVTFYQTG